MPFCDAFDKSTMPDSRIQRTEISLPTDVRALLHGAPPPVVWHLPSHVRVSQPFRFARAVSAVVLAGAVALFLGTLLTATRFRSESMAITLSLVLLAAGMHWLCQRGLSKSIRLQDDIASGRIHHGLWITPQHVLVHDLEGLRCVARCDIASLHIYHSGRPPIDLLILTLHNKATLSVLVNALDGWAGQAERLQREVQARLFAPLGITAQEVQDMAARCQPTLAFRELLRWLDDTAQRLALDAAGKTALCEMADAALRSWPDPSRIADAARFMLTEIDGSYEYGVNACGGETAYLGFLTHPSWLLPLCRRVCFDEAQRIFPSTQSVHDCAATFQAVPLRVIEFTGGFEGQVLGIFLEWAASKPLKALLAHDYSTERNSVANLTTAQREELARFKVARGLK